MNEREYQRLKDQIKSDAKKKLAALELIYGLSKDRPKSKRRARPDSSEDPSDVLPPTGEEEDNGISDDPEPELGEQYGALSKYIKSVAAQFTDWYTARNVLEKVRERYPDARAASISAAMMRMFRRNEIARLEPGSGSRPAKFKNTSP